MAKWFNEENHKRNMTPWEEYQSTKKTNEDSDSHSTYHVERKQRKKVKFTSKNRMLNLFSILIELFVTLLITIYFISPLSKINSIDVVNKSDADRVRASDIKNNLGVTENDSLFKLLFNQKDIKTDLLKNLNQISSIKIKINRLNHVKVYVDQYHIIGSLNDKKNYYLILENGKIINNSFHGSTKRGPFFYNFSSHDLLNKVIMKYNNLPNDVKDGINEIKFEPTEINPNRIYLMMKNKNQVYASLDTFDKKMFYYPSISESMKKRGIINLEVGAYSYPAK